MFINVFGIGNPNKEKIAREQCETLRDSDGFETAMVSFYEQVFKVREPWFCGGSIESNCRTSSLSGKDLDIITEFDPSRLEGLLADLSYLKELAEKRIAGIRRTEGILQIKVKRYKDGNKKLCRISVAEHDRFTDGHGDSAETEERVLEEATLPDTQKTQAAISRKLKELEEKYGVKCL